MEKYVALIAHDAKKKDMVELACQFKHVLQEFPWLEREKQESVLKTRRDYPSEKCSLDRWEATSRSAA